MTKTSEQGGIVCRSECFWSQVYVSFQSLSDLTVW
jgi:hypothetical protein